MKFRCIFDVFTLHALYKMFWAHFHDFCVQKRSCLPWNSDAFWTFSAYKLYRKGSGRNFSICASKNEAVCHFGHSLPANFTEKVLGAISWFVRPKTKLFEVKFRRILQVLRLQVLQKKFWAQFLVLCIQKWSVLLWSSDKFWKFRLSSFIKKVLGAFSRFMRPKTKLLPWNSDAFWKFSACKIKEKVVAQFHELCVQNWSCFPWSSDAFWKFSASFTEKDVGAIPRFVRLKTKLFALKFRRILEVLCLRVVQKVLGAIPRFVHPKMNLFGLKFRRILEVLRLQDLQRNFWTNFHDLCVQIRSCLLWSSDPFCKFSACKIDKKVVGTFSWFMCCTNQHSWLQHFVKMLWPRFVILHVRTSMLGCSGTLWSSYLSHFIRMFWIWTHLDCKCTHKLWCATCCIKIIQEQRRDWIAVQHFGQKKNNSCTWWIAFRSVQKHVELHNIYQEKLHVEAGCFHRIL